MTRVASHEPELVLEVMSAYYSRTPEVIQRLLTQHLARVDGLYGAIAHGDAAHRAWLKEAIAAQLAGKPVPPVQ